MDIAFVGTGLMGAPMAGRLLDAGHSLTVYNRTTSKTDPLVERGARRAAGVKDALEAHDVAILMLSDGSACRETLAGSGADLSGRLVVNMSTIAPDEQVELAGHVHGNGGRYLEAPVLGSTPQAEGGRLMIMAAGEREDFDRVRDVLGTFGPEPRFVGPTGAGATMKLACNHLIAAEFSAFALSLGMVRRSGLDVDQWMEVLRGSVIHTKMFDIKLENVVTREYPATFPAKHLLKDVELGFTHAESLGLSADSLDLVRTLFQRTVEAGRGDEDFSVVAETIDPSRT